MIHKYASELYVVNEYNGLELDCPQKGATGDTPSVGNQLINWIIGQLHANLPVINSVIGGAQPKKTNRYSKIGIVFWAFGVFFLFYFYWFGNPLSWPAIRHIAVLYFVS